ncbi:DUF126 domain-containing protein [uncultured Roseobacter sp.]|uniref:aconitase X swivel domain-containing protein n=1 Tax=uncultured Roseobacter sp. TaxID=114847 RepID=UPI00262CF727|nr:DUF126 domain-containing protein [uncultured Roseobacter sp.]
MTRSMHILCAGSAVAGVLRLTEPLSFWGGIDPATALITLAGHPQQGESVAGKALIVPGLVGSSSSSAVMLELISAGIAPAALLLGARDAILPIGVVVAGQMGLPTLPVLVVADPPWQTGDRISIGLNGQIARI